MDIQKVVEGPLDVPGGDEELKSYTIEEFRDLINTKDLMEPGKRLRRIVDQWAKAENRMKTVEGLRNEAIIPSVYELRYAGRRLADALNAFFESKTDMAVKCLIDAEFNCLRAEHDAVDAGVITMRTRYDAAMDEFGPALIQQFFPDVWKMYKTLNIMHQKIAESRQDRVFRSDAYDSLFDALEQSKELYAGLLASEKAIESVIDQQKEKEARRNQEIEEREKKSSQNNLIGWLIGGAGVLIAAVGVIIAIYK